MYIPLIAEKVASTRNISTEALSEIVRENTFRLFGNL
jgi:Tat protein secretion system quality control protein TatD with DNase activity